MSREESLVTSVSCLMVSKAFAKSSDMTVTELLVLRRSVMWMRNCDYCSCGGSKRSECKLVFEEEIHWGVLCEGIVDISLDYEPLDLPGKNGED